MAGSLFILKMATQLLIAWDDNVLQGHSPVQELLPLLQQLDYMEEYNKEYYK